MDGWLDQDGTQAAGDLELGTGGTVDGGAEDTSGTGRANDGSGGNEGALGSEGGAGGPRDAGEDQGDGLVLERPFDIRQRRKALLERYFPFLAERNGLPGENRGSAPWGGGAREEAGGVDMPDGIVGIRAGENAPGGAGGYRYPSWDWYYRQLGLEPDEIDAEASWDWALLPLPKGGLPRERMFDWPGEHFDRHVARANRLMADPGFDPFAALDAALAEDEESGLDRGAMVSMAQAGEDAGAQGSAEAGDGAGMGGDAGGGGGLQAGIEGQAAGAEAAWGQGGEGDGAGDEPRDEASDDGYFEDWWGEDTLSGDRENDPVSGTAGQSEAEPNWYYPVRNGQVTDDYGAPRKNSDGTPRKNPDGTDKVHQGTDYQNEETEERTDVSGKTVQRKERNSDRTVYALSDGVVEDVGYDSTSGNKVTIKLHNGDRVFYYHVDYNEAGLRKDDNIKGGQAIGVYDDSGNTSKNNDGNAKVAHVQIGIGGKRERSMDVEEYLRAKQAVNPPAPQHNKKNFGANGL